jgi:hypothetical protein
MADTEAPKSYRDPYYATLAADVEQRLACPGPAVVDHHHGERSNADQVSEGRAHRGADHAAHAQGAIDKYGIDAYLSPENALRWPACC